MMASNLVHSFFQRQPNHPLDLSFLDESNGFCKMPFFKFLNKKRGRPFGTASFLFTVDYFFASVLAGAFFIFFLEALPACAPPFVQHAPWPSDLLQPVAAPSFLQQALPSVVAPPFWQQEPAGLSDFSASVVFSVFSFVSVEVV